MPSLSSLFSKRHFKWFVILSSIIVIQVLELLLLQRKYDLFTGGFLQPYSYQAFSDRLLFLGLSLWMDLALFGSIGILWFRLAEYRGIHRFIAGFSYAFILLSTMGSWLALKFKVLSYFNDTLNFLIIKNLGGGSLLEAFRYVADEAAIFGIGLVILALAYWIGLRWVKKVITRSTSQHEDSDEAGSWSWPLLLIAAVLTIGLSAIINADPLLRYGMEKKTSYALISKSLDEITDIDRDGYGLFRFPTDSNSWNANIYPGALDYPDDGIDEDGYGGDFKWEGRKPDTLASLPPIPGRHILLIVLESARSDLIGKRWKKQPVAPNITRLAETGTSIEYAYSHTGYTTSSIRAIFSRTLSRGNDRVRLTDFLDGSGYSVSVISGQDESFGGVALSTGMKAPGHYYFDARSALDDRVFPSKEPGSLRLSEERILQQFNTRVDEIDWNRPNFLYVNLQAAHFPYSHPKMPALINKTPIARADISYENRSELQATYWNAIAVADQAVGAMLQKLRDIGVYKDTTVIILGDHGESLFDDNFLGHGHALNEIQTRIPLVINDPGLEIRGAVGQLDVAELLASIASGRFDKAQWNDPDRIQLQVIGSLDKPLLVGTVATGEVRTVLDFRTREVFFSDLKRWEDFDDALNDSELGQRTKRLLYAWEEARWENYLSRHGETRGLVE